MRTRTFGRSDAAGAAFADVARVVVAGSFFVGAVFAPDVFALVDLEPARAGVPEARPFDLVLVAMPSRLGPTADDGRQEPASVLDRPSDAGRAAAAQCRLRSGQPSSRTMVSRLPREATTANPSLR